MLFLIHRLELKPGTQRDVPYTGEPGTQRDVPYTGENLKFRNTKYYSL